MDKEGPLENDDSLISIVKTEPEDFLTVEYNEPNDQSEVLHFGSGEDTPYPENQYENLPIPEGFHFKQECHDNGGDVDYRMESYQGEQFHPFEYPQLAANSLEQLGQWQYRNGFVPPGTDPAFSDQPGTSDMNLFAEKREEQLYPCRYCEYVANHPRSLSSHMNNRHTKSVVYQCPHCPYNSTIPRSVKDHVECKHDNEDDKPIEIKRKCEFCDYSAGNATALKNHMNKHTKEKQHQCSFCEFNTLWEGYLKMHIRRKHGDLTMGTGNSVKEYPCQYCNYKALTPSSLKLHTNKHTREQEHQCPYCPYKTVWTTYIKLHIKNKHLKEEKSPSSKEYACSFCDYKAKNTTLLKQHVNKHTREKINQCPHCPFTTLWITYMKLHIKRKHTVKTEGETALEKRDFQCNYCSYKAISSSHLKIHENKHTKAVEYKCEECDFKTTWYGYLKLHTKRKHTLNVKEENPSNKTTYPCQFCSYQAINLSTLKVHQNKHTREVLYNCPHCDFKTTWRAYIKMHIQKHNVQNFKSRKQQFEGIRSFPCQYCDYKATQLGSLKLHVNSKHTRKVLHKCPKCDYQCAVYGNLKMHIRRKHGLKPEPDGKYHCKECEFSSENSSDLKIHLNEKHDVKIEIEDIKKENDKVYSCQHCSYQTLYPQVMEKHINKHTRQNVFQCPHCPYSTVWNHYMKVHIRRHSEPKTGRQRFTRPNTDESRMFPCQYCEHRSISSSSLRDHVNSVHTREVFFKCPYCDHKCTLKGNLRGHIRRKHPAQFVESEKRYSCSHCDFKTALMRNLKIHQKNEHNIDLVQIKTENGEFPCQHCNYKARSYYALKIHTNKHTKENSYRCPQCEFETRWPNYLTKHIQQHSLNKRKVTCLYCDYKGCSTFRLRKHIEGLHKIDKYYPCPKPQCEFKTIHYTSLRIHLKGNIHADGRKKSSMAMTRNYSYKYEPNEGRYFACDYCDYASKTQGNLDLHMKNKHVKTHLWKCGLCHYKSPSKSYLNRHFKVKHLGKLESEEFVDDSKLNIEIKEEDFKEEISEKEEDPHFAASLVECELKENVVETRRCGRRRNSVPSYFEVDTEEDEISSDTNDFNAQIFQASHVNENENVEKNTDVSEHCENASVETVNPKMEFYQNAEIKVKEEIFEENIVNSNNMKEMAEIQNKSENLNSKNENVNFEASSTEIQYNRIEDVSTANQIQSNVQSVDGTGSNDHSVQSYENVKTQIAPRQRRRIKLTPRRVFKNNYGSLQTRDQKGNMMRCETNKKEQSLQSIDNEKINKFKDELISENPYNSSETTTPNILSILELQSNLKKSHSFNESSSNKVDSVELENTHKSLPSEGDKVNNGYTDVLRTIKFESSFSESGCEEKSLNQEDNGSSEALVNVSVKQEPESYTNIDVADANTVECAAINSVEHVQNTSQLIEHMSAENCNFKREPDELKQVLEVTGTTQNILEPM
ncbi:hypothetical protein WA026_001487 [Henosepilachna vigintioctopunctata]|uniref:C2H2-type domain-containing protein n=1 Tax=Henosepilachna vigintioctopunctata TaxID=420089 RepID=A0AAW1UTJ6_9CUCU